MINSYLLTYFMILQDVAYLDLCSHATVQSSTAGSIGSQSDDDADDDDDNNNDDEGADEGDDVSVCSITSTQVTDCSSITSTQVTDYSSITSTQVTDCSSTDM